MKKKNKLIASLLIVTTFFSNLAGVSAKTLTINEVDKAFKNAMKENLGADVTTTIDTANNKYIISGKGSDEKFSLNIGDGYIEYVEEAKEITDEIAYKQMGVMLIIGGMMQGIIDASGHNTKALTSKLDADAFLSEEAWNKYGLFISTQKYENSTTTENGTSSIKTDIFRQFKMSFDTTKIDKLVEDYGIDKGTEPTPTEDPTPSTPAEDPTPSTPTDSKEQPKSDTNEDKELQNPDTGAFMSLPTLITLLSIGFVVITLSRRYSLFRRI